jgi:hypothetical protein
VVIGGQGRVDGSVTVKMWEEVVVMMKLMLMRKDAGR